MRNTRGSDQNIEPAVFIQGRLRHRVVSSGGGSIRADEDHLTTVALDFSGRALACIAVDVRDYELRALLREAHSGSPADTAGTACDNCNPSFQPAAHNFSPGAGRVLVEFVNAPDVFAHYQAGAALVQPFEQLFEFGHP